MWLVFFALLVAVASDELTSVPSQRSIRRVPDTQKAVTRRSKWVEDAIEKMWMERDAMEVTPIMPFRYEGAPMVEIAFKNESATKIGASHFRTMWTLYMSALQQGNINKETFIVDASLGGNSALAFVYFARLLELKCLIFVPIEMAQQKLDQLIEMRAKIIRGHVSFLARRPREEADKDPNGFFLNSAGAFHENEFEIPVQHKEKSINLLSEFSNQLRSSKNVDMDFFVSTVNSGALISSAWSEVSRHAMKTKLVAVDSQFSTIYDYAVNDQFTTTHGMDVWKFPGIPEVGAGPAAPMQFGNTTSFKASMVNSILKLPDLAVVAAMWVLRDKGIDGGPSTGANFLASLHVAADTDPLGFITIGTMIEEPGILYEDTYYNRTWVVQQFGRHGARWGFDCWLHAIDESLNTGWSPITNGVDLGCPTRYL